MVGCSIGFVLSRCCGFCAAALLAFVFLALCGVRTSALFAFGFLVFVSAFNVACGFASFCFVLCMTYASSRSFCSPATFSVWMAMQDCCRSTMVELDSQRFKGIVHTSSDDAAAETSL